MYTIKKWVPLLLCLLLLTGCQGNPLPEGMEEDAVLEAGQEVVAALVRGEYEDVAARFRQDVQVDSDQVQALLETAAQGAGEYKEIEDSMATGRESEGEALAVAVIMTKYEKRRLVFEVGFDPDMTLIGLRIEKK